MAIPSIVVISLSINSTAGLLQLKTLFPSTSTAHDPHCSRPQPNLVPVKLKSSLITNNKGLMSKINEITDAKIEDGGGGAFYIFLKKNKSTK